MFNTTRRWCPFWIRLLNLGYSVRLRQSGMRFFSHGSEKHRCPYKGCERQFEKPTVITDTSTIPRQTHYACPYCMSRLTIITEETKIVGIYAAEYPTVFDSPAKCAHFNGLTNAPAGVLPDECLVCPKVVQCNIRRK